ncbi:MAG: MFS transporter [Steroidobacteraceae bacterium]
MTTGLPLSLRASWGLGGLGATSMLYLINLFVVFYLVRHVGMPAAIAGTLLAITRIYDAVIDPLIGTLSDRSQSRWGKRRPLMFAGALLSTAGCVAVFNLPSMNIGPALYVFALAALLLYCTGYSLFAIPYMAQGAEMTNDYAERATLMAWRTFFVYTAGIVITAGAPALIAALGGKKDAYALMSVAAAVVVGATMLWVVAATGKAPALSPGIGTSTPAASYRSALKNKPFLVILLVKMTLQLGTAFIGAAFLFFLSDVLRRGESALALFGLASNLVGVAAVPLWNRALRTIERRSLAIALFAALGLVNLSWLFAVPSEPQVFLLLRAVLSGALGSGSVLVAMAMLADTIEYDRLCSKEQRGGLFVGLFELMQTTSFVLGPLIVGFAFSAAGMISGDAGRGAQPQSAVDMTRYAVALVPAACQLLGIGLIMLYKLDADTLARLRDADRPQPAAGAPA